MKAIKYLSILIILALTSCFDEYTTYSGDNYIQFGPELSRIYTASYNYLDTTKLYSFFYYPATKTQDTVWFDIYSMGEVSGQDRPFVLEQEMLTGVENAVSGTHYKAFGDPSVSGKYVIKAGTSNTRVPVVLLRNASLKAKEYILRLKVIENENFKPGEKALLWRKVIFSDKLSQPAAWNASAIQYYWGKYSTVKHTFMIEKTGEKWDQDFMVGLPSNYALLTYWRVKLKTFLAEYNAAHPGSPLKDEFGELVVFP
jgi:hypothetical protein